jgi:hypothetical protein
MKDKLLSSIDLILGMQLKDGTISQRDYEDATRFLDAVISGGW